jgi:hypothetical protein
MNLYIPNADPTAIRLYFDSLRAILDSDSQVFPYGMTGTFLTAAVLERGWQVAT